MTPTPNSAGTPKGAHYPGGRMLGISLLQLLSLLGGLGIAAYLVLTYLVM